jgi:hypothetical protein
MELAGILVWGLELGVWSFLFGNILYLTIMFIQKAIPFLFALSVAFICLALSGIIMHWDNSLFLFTAAMGTQFAFAFAAIYELRKNGGMMRQEKTTWTLLLLICPMLFGIIYLKKIRTQNPVSM